MKSIAKLTLLQCLIISFGLLAVNENDDFVYDLSLATQGISVSQYNTGVNYSIGRGISKDLEKAVYWYQRAHEQGCVETFTLCICCTNRPPKGDRSEGF